ncbi:hypothetical protein [Cytophaga aurantiaca]|nr:hypothetical protein [Cytophaga aurantiaca]
MKKILLIFISLVLLAFSSCRSSSTPGQYHGQMTEKKPCAQGCK